MGKLTRLTGKVFAGEADLEDLGVFGSAKAGQGVNPTATDTEAQIQAGTAYGEGWTSAVVSNKNFPPVEEVNGVLRTISYQNCYLLQEGMPSYDADTEYSNTSIVKALNNNGIVFYRSLQDGNIGNSLSDTDYWEVVEFPYNNYNFDGQWEFSTQLLSSATSIGVYTVDVSAYLPNDAYTYEIKVCYMGFRQSGDTNSSVSICPTSNVIEAATTDIGTVACYGVCNFDGNHAEAGNIECSVIVDGNRTFYLGIKLANLYYSRLAMVAYRRLGTNQ